MLSSACVSVCSFSVLSPPFRESFVVSSSVSILCTFVGKVDVVVLVSLLHALKDGNEYNRVALDVVLALFKTSSKMASVPQARSPLSSD